MERIDWLNRTGIVLCRHYGSAELLVRAGSACVSLAVLAAELRIIGTGATLADAAEDAVSRLTNAEILAASVGLDFDGRPGKN